jgi:hypothetical protein
MSSIDYTKLFKEKDIFGLEDLQPTFNFFDGAVYINRDDRSDRRKHVESVLTDNGIKAFRVPGYNLNQSHLEAIGFPLTKRKVASVIIKHIGCSAAHFHVVHQAMKLNLNSILIFEDDIVFTDDSKAVIQSMIRDVQEHDIDWDLFYIGGKPVGKIDKVTDNVYTTAGCLDTHAYAINGKFLSKLISTNVVTQYDSYVCRLGCNVIIPPKPICYQAPLPSDILGAKYDDYESVQRQYEKNL